MTLDQLACGAVFVCIAAGMFAVAFALHVVVWRKSSARPSAVTLIALLSAAIIVQAFAAALAAVQGGLPFSLPMILVIGALALQIAACYVISYPAMQAHSPSLEIAQRLATAEAHGLTPAELYAALSEDSLVRERIEDLLNDGLAKQEGELLYCTPRGATMARAFRCWRALLREPKGG